MPRTMSDSGYKGFLALSKSSTGLMIRACLYTDTHAELPTAVIYVIMSYLLFCKKSTTRRNPSETW